MKKSFFVPMSVFVLFALFGLQSVFAAGVHSNDDPPCYDITGSTTAVLVQGVNNGGIMHFDAPSSVLAPEYAACVRMTADPESFPNAAPSHLEGWVWNTNLGWISLYCGDDNGEKKNLGIPCGNHDYKVDFSVFGFGPDFNSVSLSGYAWGDNVGYISFNSTNHHQLSPVPNGFDRGLVSSSLSDSARFTWADSIGWFDWTGVRFYWENVEIEPLEICPIKDQQDGKCKCNLAKSTCLYTSDVIPLADGVDSWDITVNFVDENGSALNKNDMKQEKLLNGSYVPMSTEVSNDNKAYGFYLNFEWSDTVSFDQTINASQSSENCVNFNCPVNKEIGSISVDKLSDDGTFKTKITSYAPTSNMNTSPMSQEGMKLNNERFFYYDREKLSDIDGGNYNVKSSNVGKSNQLKLDSIKVLLIKYAVPAVGLHTAQDAICIIGNLQSSGQECHPITVNPGDIDFRPVVEFSDLYQKSGDKKLDFLSLVARTAVEIPYVLTNHNNNRVSNFSAEVNLGEMSDILQKLGYLMGFVNQGDNSFVNDDEEGSLKIIKNTTFSNPVSDSLYVLLGLQDSDATPSSLPQDVDPYIYTKISYTIDDKEVAYWSNKLPKQSAGLLINPVAFVRGSVSGSVFKPGASDVSVNNLGSFYSNITRDRIHRSVAALKANKQIVNKNSSVTVYSFDATGFAGLNDLGNGVYYYEGGDVTIACHSACVTNSNVTIIVQNGSVILKSDIIPISGAQVGIIVFDEEENPLYIEQNKLGNLYVESKVIDILNTHIYLDGLLLSYREGDDYGINGNTGWPIFADDVDRQDSLVNQLRLFGTLTSSNGFGNAYLSVPLDHNNLPVTSISSYSAPSGMALARSVDLNYLRYYGPGIELCSNGLVKDQQGVDDAACTESGSYAIDLTKMKDEGGDLVPGRAGGQKAQLYKKQSTLDTEFPVYFEFQAVKNDLRGFNQAVDIKY